MWHPGNDLLHACGRSKHTNSDLYVVWMLPLAAHTEETGDDPRPPVLLFRWTLPTQPPWACRPFLWKGEVFATASVWGEDSSRVWECILRLDLDAGLLAAEFCFDEMPIRTNVTM